jgi:hypothetical protein
MNTPPDARIEAGWNDDAASRAIGGILVECSPDFPAEGAGDSGAPVEQE